MTALVIADDDFIVPRLPEGRADLLISCGDITDEMIVRAAQAYGCHEILAVKGNHDSSSPFRVPIKDLHLTTFTFRGMQFGGFCGSWKYKPRGNYLFEQHEVEDKLKEFPPVDVFVTHNSPRLVHDRDDEVHLGFTAFNTYVTRAKPKFLLHGHQHQQIESRLDGTQVIGTYGARVLVIPD